MTTPTQPSNPPGDAPDDLGSREQAGLRGMARRGTHAVTSRADAATSWLERARTRSTLVDIGFRLRERDQEAAGSVAGSAVAFRLFLFFVPLVLVVVAVAGFLAAHLSARDVSTQAGVSGGVAKQIEAAFTQPSTTRWTALLTGLFGVASAGRTLSKTLALASGLSWQMEFRPKATVRITGIVIGIITSLALLSSVVNRIRMSAGVAVAGMSIVGASVAYLVAWLVLSLWLPRATSDPGAVLPGAALMGVALAGLQAVTQLYIPGKVSHASALYGTIGITIVTLGWFFIIGRLTVLSMTLNAVVYERLGSITALFFGLPLLRVIPAKSTHGANFFGLPHDGQDDEGGPSD